MEHNHPQLLSLPTLAAALRLPEDWLKAEADAGRLPHIRIGKRYRFSLAAVEAALLRRAASTGCTVPLPESADRSRPRAKRTSQPQTNTAGGLPPRRPSDDRPIPPVTEGNVDG
jgi:excisionase family DNA binding protein